MGSEDVGRMGRGCGKEGEGCGRRIRKGPVGRMGRGLWEGRGGGVGEE